MKTNEKIKIKNFRAKKRKLKFRIFYLIWNMRGNDEREIKKIEKNCLNGKTIKNAPLEGNVKLKC